MKRSPALFRSCSVGAPEPATSDAKCPQAYSLLSYMIESVCQVACCGVGDHPNLRGHQHQIQRMVMARQLLK